MDLLLFQPAPQWEGTRAFGAISNGLLALAAFLRTKGLEVKICHFNVAEPIGSIVERKLALYSPRVVGINLTWHLLCAAALRLAREVKQHDSSVKVVMGGATASCFDKELLEYVRDQSAATRDEPWVDLIVRGDGEVPLYEYLTRNVPPKCNVSFLSQTGRVVQKPIRYVQDTIPRVRLDDVERLIDNWPEYLDRDGVRTSVPGLEHDLGHNRAPREVDVFIGKGCRNNCCYCGGCAQAQKRLSGRLRPIFRPVKDAVADIVSFHNGGTQRIYISFDPHPDRSFYSTLFSELQKQLTGDLSLLFSCWSGPLDAKLLDLIERVFSNAEFVISPDSGSENLRHELLLRGYGKRPFYRNADLLHFLQELQNRSMKAMCYFTAGLPWEGAEDWQETLLLGERIRDRFENIFVKPHDERVERNLTCIPLYIEPGSPIWYDPDRFRFVVYRRSFQDFLVNSADPSATGFLGGWRKRFSSERNVIERATEFANVVSGVGEAI